MKAVFTALIISQMKNFTVMMAAGVLTETLWQIKQAPLGILKKAAKKKNRKSGTEQDVEAGKHPRTGNQMPFAAVLTAETLFWIAAAVITSSFLYYCSYGKLSFHACAGYLIGLLLWKKILHYVILDPWERNGEARNSKITVRSSTWRRPGGSAWKSVRQKKDGKKRR